MITNDSVILAFGDSLTYGFGTAYEFSYPKIMEKKTSLSIINAGVNGEFSSEGVVRLWALLEKHKPDLVILCHGCNDFINNYSKKNLKDNLLSMVRMIKTSKSEVLLVGVPNFLSSNFSIDAIYKEIAIEENLLLEDEILTAVEKDDSLKSDFVHPNAKGYEMMADAFIKILRL